MNNRTHPFRHATAGTAAAAGFMAACGLLACGPSAHAQPVAGAVAPASGTLGADWSVSLTPTGSYAFRADLRDAPGSVAVSRAGLTAGFGWRVDDSLRLGLTLAGEGSWYAFNDATTIIPGVSTPFSDMYTANINPTASFRIDEDWSLTLGGLFTFSGEPGVSVGEAFTGGGLAAARYQASPELALTFGIVGGSRLSKTAMFFPVIGVDWDITNTVYFRTKALTAELGANITKQFSVYINGGYESRDYRLDDSAPLPGGVVRDRQAPFGVGLHYYPAPSVVCSIQGGAIVWQKYKTDDNSGNEVSSVQTKPAAFISATVEIKF